MTDNRTTELLQGAEGGGRMSEYVYDMSDCRDPIREEIVRCRDCKWFTPERESETSGCFEILHPAFCDKHIAKAEPDGFCAWAEKRTDE